MVDDVQWPEIGSIWYGKRYGWEAGEGRYVRVDHYVELVQSVDDEPGTGKLAVSVSVLTPEKRERLRTVIPLKAFYKTNKIVGADESQDTLQILRRARDLVAKGWTTGVYARDANDNRVPDSSDEAAKFGADGALCRATFDVRKAHPGRGSESAFLELRRHARPFGLTITRWNDACETSAPILKAFDAAIVERSVFEQTRTTDIQRIVRPSRKPTK